MIYVDTSVIVAALDPRDARHKVARETLERFDDKIVSELVLAELASVLTRKPHIVKNVAKRLRLSKEEAVVTILIYVLNRFGIKYRSVDGAVRLPILGNVYVPVALAIELSSRARLKTLEQLHLAYAKAMKEGGEPIDVILTADAGFEKAKELLKEFGIELRIIQ